MTTAILPTTTRFLETNTAAQASRAINTLVHAFADDPAARWMYPGGRQYSEWFPDFVWAFAGRAWESDGADSIEEFSGVALWLAPGVTPDDTTLMQVVERSVSMDRLPEVLAVLEQMGAVHPAEPHWYLPMIGVDPGRQGRGLGSVLLQQGLARCDRDRVPAYLEATSERNAALYERFGFTPVARIQTATSPTIIPMIRRIHG